MEINVTIDTEDSDANTVGEFLLSDINPHFRWGYETRDIEGHWSEFQKSVPLKILTLLKGCFAKFEGEEGVTVLKNNDGILAYLYWDGDGTLVFELPDGNVLVNSDMKKSYDWEWNPEWVYDLPENYYV